MADVQKQIMMPPSFLFKLVQNERPNLQEVKNAFLNDCKVHLPQNDVIPYKKDTYLRIITFNVRLWTNLYDRSNFDEIIFIIKKLDPDIVVLQEVTDWQRTYDTFINLGYDTKSIGCVTTNPCFGPAIFSKNLKIKNSFAAIFKNQSSVSRQLSYVRLDLSYHDINFSVYGTHLEVDDFINKSSFEHVRALQINEILEDAKTLSHENIIIAGDFNTIRKEDFNDHINDIYAWDLITQLYNDTMDQKLSLNALDQFRQNDYNASFELLKWHNPKFTSWFFRPTDFIYFSPFKLTLDGSYVYYTDCSDHLPIVVDFALH